MKHVLTNRLAENDHKPTENFRTQFKTKPKTGSKPTDASQPTCFGSSLDRLCKRIRTVQDMVAHMHYYLEMAGPGKVRVLQPRSEARQQRRTIPCLVECKESVLARQELERARAKPFASEQRSSADTGGGIWALFSVEELAELGWVEPDALAPSAMPCGVQEGSVKAVCRSPKSQRCHPARRAGSRNKINQAAKPALTVAVVLLMLLRLMASAFLGQCVRWIWGALRCGVVFIKMSVRGIMSLCQPVGERTPSWAQQRRRKKRRMRAWPARTAKPSHHQTPAALYYLRHLRSIAAAAHGCKA